MLKRICGNCRSHSITQKLWIYFSKSSVFSESSQPYEFGGINVFLITTFTLHEPMRSGGLLVWRHSLKVTHCLKLELTTLFKTVTKCKKLTRQQSLPTLDLNNLRWNSQHATFLCNYRPAAKINLFLLISLQVLILFLIKKVTCVWVGQSRTKRKLSLFL